MPPKMVATVRPVACASGSEHRVDLAGQLPGGHQDQAARAAGAGVPVGQPGGQRDREPERLAGPGPAAAQDVPPGQRIRQRGRLDRERDGDPGLGQHARPAAPGTPSSAKLARSARPRWSMPSAALVSPRLVLRRGVLRRPGLGADCGRRRPAAVPGRARRRRRRAGRRILDGQSCH